MDIETINTLTVIGFGNIALIFIIVWVIQTWREEMRRVNRGEKTRTAGPHK